MVPWDLILGAWWAPVGITLVIIGSAVFPPLPSETLLVTATALALAGELNLAAVLLATTLGALLADLTVYALGRCLSRRTRHNASRSARGRRALRWLDEHQATWGQGLVIAGRFIPGGTTAVGLSAGIVAYPLPRFLTAAVIGAVLWTAYGLGLASLGRTVLPGSTWASVLLAIVLTVATTGVIGIADRLRTRRRDGTTSAGCAPPESE